MSKKDQILNYDAEKFINLNDQQAFRHTPAQFLGYTGNKGFINMMREIFQNAADEVVKDDSPADQIWVSYSEQSHEFMVKDNGRGIPSDVMIKAFGDSHTSSNYKKKPGEFSSGRHGVGSKAVNACSEFFIVDSYRLGVHYRVTFKYGDPKTAKLEHLKDEPGMQGTIVVFKPIDTMPKNFSDKEDGNKVMGKVTVTCEDVVELINSLLPLLKIGTKVNFIGIDSKGKHNSVLLINRNGIIDGLNAITAAPIIEPIHFNEMAEDGSKKGEIAFTYDKESAEEQIISFGNFCPTVDGTHVKGFTDGITKYFKDYMNKFFLSNRTKITIKNEDIRSGLRAVISVAHLEPEFTGQAKEIISNEDLTPFIKDITIKHLTQWAKKNPNDLQKICKYFKDVAEIRIKGEKGRAKIEVKNASAVTGLPSKYTKPTGKEHTELFIVEGDSAKGSITNKRVNERQGIFPIRGKIVNTFSATRDKVIKNEEIAGIISIIGAGYGKGFVIDKCNWEKIIIATDADPDGAHIRVLLLKFFLLYMLPLIEAGKLYATVPPLYGGKINRKYRFFTDRSEYNSYIQSVFVKEYSLTTGNGIKITKNELIKILDENEGYIDTLESIAYGYAIDPYLLEDICLVYDKPFKDIKKYIESRYRDMEVHKEKNLISITGVVSDYYQSILYNEDLLNRFKEIREYLDKSPISYKVNGERKSLYELLKLIRKLEPSNITRFKGLGEMNPQQLFDSTIDPDGGRTLIRYTVEDVKNEIDKLKELESDNMKLLKDIDISTFVF